MKKLVLTTVCALAMTGAAFAQGYVSYSPSGFENWQTNGTTYSPLFGGGASGSGSSGVVFAGTTLPFAYDYALLYYTGGVYNGVTPVASVWGGSWAYSGLIGTNSNTAGRVGAVNGSTGVQVGPGLNGASPTAGGWANGTTNYIEMVGWSVNLGTSWVTVSNVLANWATLGSTITGPAYFGISAMVGSIRERRLLVLLE